MGLWRDTLCGCGITTRMADEVCETFTTIYNAVGGIGSGAMIPLSPLWRDGVPEFHCPTGLLTLAPYLC